MKTVLAVSLISGGVAAYSFRSEIKAHEPLSMVELESGTTQKLHQAEAEAQVKAKKAEEAWLESRKKSDTLLAEVRSQMAKLNEDLKKTAEKQKEDLVMLEKSREKESSALKATENQLKQLQDKAKVEAPLPSSFLEDPSQADFLGPLRKAAAEAEAFAKKMHEESQMRISSFLEGGEDDYASKAERSLAMARQALSKLDTDLASQKRELEVQLSKAEKDEEALKEGASLHASFLQTGTQYDPLSRAALTEWREKFNAQLQRAREAAGIKTPMTSLVELDTSETDEKLKEDENKVARLQEAFNSQMEKLKSDNAALLSEAEAQIEKAKKMKSKLDADLRASSFIQGDSGSHRFNADAEKEKILALQHKWQSEAKQLAQPSQPSEAEKQLSHLIEDQKTKQATAQAELERLKLKLHKDIEALHKDMSMSAFSTKTPSFIQEKVQVASKLRNDDDDYDYQDELTTEDDDMGSERIDSSFMETQDETDLALAKAEQNLRSLQEKLHKQLSELNAPAQPQ